MFTNNLFKSKCLSTTFFYDKYLIIFSENFFLAPEVDAVGLFI